MVLQVFSLKKKTVFEENRFSVYGQLSYVTPSNIIYSTVIKW